MGNCIKSKPLPDNTYTVRVINDGQNLEGQAKGFLQVTDTNLILTLQVDRRKKIEWPLKHLRRYGCDGHIFSIEAGSKCPAGQGMYAFSTEHAQELFEVVAKTVSNRSAHHDLHSSVSDLEASSSPPIVSNGHASTKRSTESLNRQASPAAESLASPPSNTAVFKNDAPVSSGASNPRSSPVKPEKPLNYPPIVLEEPSTKGIVSSKPKVGYTTVNFEKTEELREKIDHHKTSHLPDMHSTSPQVSGSNDKYINFNFPSGPNSPPNGVNQAYKNLEFNHPTHEGSSVSSTSEYPSANPNYKNWGMHPSHNSYTNVSLGSAMGTQPKLQYAMVEFTNQQPSEVKEPESTTYNYSKLDPVAMMAWAKTQKEHEEEKERKRHAVRNSS